MEAVELLWAWVDHWTWVGHLAWVAFVMLKLEALALDQVVPWEVEDLLRLEDPCLSNLEIAKWKLVAYQNSRLVDH